MSELTKAREALSMAQNFLGGSRDTCFAGERRYWDAYQAGIDEIDAWNRRATQPASAPADIPTWQERIANNGMRGTEHASMLAEIADLRAALAAVGAPQGQAEPVAGDFVLVPRVPTEAMIDAGGREIAFKTQHFGGARTLARYSSPDVEAENRSRAEHAYRAMIAAAPTQPTQPAERADWQGQVREAVAKMAKGYEYGAAYYNQDVFVDGLQACFKLCGHPVED